MVTRVRRISYVSEALQSVRPTTRDNFFSMCEDAVREKSQLVVVSANLDHLFHEAAGSYKEIREKPGVRWIYLVDGSPLAVILSLKKQTVYQRMSGSDLLVPLLAWAESLDLKVGFLGGSSIAQAAIRRRIIRDHPGLAEPLLLSPTRSDLQEDHLALDLAVRIRRAGVQLLIVGLGKPRQEDWLSKYGPDSGVAVSVAFGAAADFYAGVIRRAPSIVRMVGLEWLWRLSREPRRLWRRYLVEAPQALMILIRYPATSDDAEDG